MWDREVSIIFTINLVVPFKSLRVGPACWYGIITESDVRNGPLKVSYGDVKRSVERVLSIHIANVSQ
jgi:hypothetical protein